MMKLSTMYKVDCMVGTNGQNPVAEQILKRWEHERGSMRFFRSSANFVYVFRNEGRQNFLRFAESSERTRETIEAEMDILHWVARRGMTVTTPIQSRNGHFVETVVTELGTFHAVVFAGLEGSQLDIRELDDSQFREWGAALGKLHAALRTYVGPGLSVRSTWKDHLEMVRAFLPEDESTLCIECEQIASSLQELPMTSANYGLVHFDFELDNLYWHDHTIGIGDFDDCGHSWYVSDIAWALRDLFGDSIDLNKRSFRAFVRGYSEQYPLDEELLDHLPLFLRMAKLLTYARLVRAMDLPDHSEEPAWLGSLRMKLKNWMNVYKASLENLT